MSEVHITYHQGVRELLKHQFKGCDKLECSYSNEHQDIFVLSILDGKQYGTYLEVGANQPIGANNTYVLEKYFKWRGVSVEIDLSHQTSWQVSRTNPIIFQDATAVDYEQLLHQNQLGPIIDYLSCDLNPSTITLAALKKIPHDVVRFRVITFEHEAYLSLDGMQVRADSREFLNNLGYKMIINDVGNTDHTNGKYICEDWWIDPNLVDPNLVKKLTFIENDRVIHNDTVYKNWKKI
jgi:hypothetical protein